MIDTEWLSLIKQLAHYDGETLPALLAKTSASCLDELGHELARFGVSLQQSAQTGYYRLATPCHWLDRETILNTLSPSRRSQLNLLDIFPIIDSTNTYLLNREEDTMVSGHACFAEYQQAGRGRWGRSWLSPLGQNIYLSVAWLFPQQVALAALPMVLGVAIAERLHRLGINNIGLKWPNDIIWQNKKVGGILIETRPLRSRQRVAVIAGVGLNLYPPDIQGKYTKEKKDYPWGGLLALGKYPLTRSQLAGEMLDCLLEGLHRATQDRVILPDSRWQTWNLLLNKRLTLQSDQGQIHGKVLGINAQGQLILMTGKGVRQYDDHHVSIQHLP